MTLNMTTITRVLQHRLAALIVGGAVAGLSAGLATVIAQNSDLNQPVDFTHTVLDAPAPVAGAVFGSGSALHPGDRICTTPFQTTANVDTDCDKSGPSN